MRLLPFLLCSFLAGCAASPADRLARLYEENWEEQEGTPSRRDPLELVRRQEARSDEVKDILAQDEGLSATERLYAAAILKDSNRVEDLELARDLALEVANGGDVRGLPLAAEAIDRLCRAEGRPQKYGTQYEFDPATRKWRLCPWDPSTTDAERRAMGLPNLDEARRRAALLNRM